MNTSLYSNLRSYTYMQANLIDLSDLVNFSDQKDVTLNLNIESSGQEGPPEDEETDEKEGYQDGEAKEEDEPGVGRGGGQGPPQAVLLVLPFCGVRYVECHRAGNERYVGGMLQDTQENI